MPNPELPQPAPFLYGLARTAGIQSDPDCIGKCRIRFPPGAFNAAVSVPIINTVNALSQKGPAGIWSVIRAGITQRKPRRPLASGATLHLAEQRRPRNEAWPRTGFLRQPRVFAYRSPLPHRDDARDL